MLMRSRPQEQSCFLHKPGASVGFSANQHVHLEPRRGAVFYFPINVILSLRKWFYFGISAEYELIIVFLLSPTHVAGKTL